MRLAAIVRFVRNGMGPLVVLVVLCALRRFGLSGATPLWVLAAVLVPGAVLQQPAVQRRLAGDDPEGRVGLRVSLHVTLATLVMYLTGWGALLAVAHLHILSAHLKQSGSRVWRPTAVATAVTVALGQAAFAAGLVPSYLPVTPTHGLALLIALGTVTTIRALGLAAEHREIAEQALRRSEERFRALIRDGYEMITESAADGTVAYVSPAALTVLGYEPESLAGRQVAALIHPDDRVRTAELHAELLASDGTGEVTMEIRVKHADGGWRWHEISMRNLLDHPEVHAVIAHHRDITGRRLAQDRIAYAANHDDLTGLANAPTLGRDLERALAQGTRYQHPVGVLFLDLDGFKAVNDTYGHAVGDRLLTTISDVIRRAVRDSDTVGRLGGDEFGVVLTRVAGADEALAVADRIIRGIETNSSVAGLKLDIGCSIGVTLAPPGGSDAKTMLRHADAAMYRSKRRGRNGVQLYEPGEVTMPWLV